MGRTPAIVQHATPVYQPKLNRLLCTCCGNEILKKRLNSAYILISYDIFTDSSRFDLLCSKCGKSKTEEQIIQINKLFHKYAIQAIANLYHYLSADTVSLFKFLRFIEDICIKLKLKPSFDTKTDKYTEFMNNKSVKAENLWLFAKTRKFSKTELDDTDSDDNQGELDFDYQITDTPDPEGDEVPIAIAVEED